MYRSLLVDFTHILAWSLEGPSGAEFYRAVLEGPFKNKRREGVMLECTDAQISPVRG